MSSNKTKKNSDSYYLASQWVLMKRKLMKHKLAVVSMILLGIMYFLALIGQFVSPQGLTSYDSKYMNAPPTQIHWFDNGKFNFRPFVYGVISSRDPVTYRKTFVEDKSVKYNIKLFTHGLEYKYLGMFKSNLHFFGVDDPGRIFLLGTDGMGRDLFSRIILGSQISLTLPFAGALISFLLGIVIGSISGYFGGFIDTIIQRIIEVLMSFPQIPLWMALSAAIPARVSPVTMYLMVTIILSLINWTGLARTVRSKFISLRKEDYVMAAQVAGVTPFKIIVKHLVPGFMSYLIVSVTLSIPSMIMGETSMSFLGLGIRSPATSWGVLLQEAQQVQNVALYPWKLIPLIPVVLAVLAYNFLGDGLRDAADPYK